MLYIVLVLGVVGGSIAAGVQSTIGNVAAGMNTLSQITLLCGL